MGVVVEYPITVHVGSAGGTFLLENTLVSQRTKNIDICHHFIRDYVGDGTVKIQFVRSEENLADPFTNNLSNGPFHSLIAGHI